MPRTPGVQNTKDGGGLGGKGVGTQANGGVMGTQGYREVLKGTKAVEGVQGGLHKGQKRGKGTLSPSGTEGQE